MTTYKTTRSRFHSSSVGLIEMPSEGGMQLERILMLHSDFVNISYIISSMQWRCRKNQDMVSSLSQFGSVRFYVAVSLD